MYTKKRRQRNGRLATAYFVSRFGSVFYIDLEFPKTRQTHPYAYNTLENLTRPIILPEICEIVVTFSPPTLNSYHLELTHPSKESLLKFGPHLETNPQALSPLASARPLELQSLLIRRRRQRPLFHNQSVYPCLCRHTSMPIRGPRLLNRSLPSRLVFRHPEYLLTSSRRNHNAPVVSIAIIAVIKKTRRRFPLPLSSLKFIPNIEVARLTGT